MNQVLHEGAAMAQMGWLLGITTAFFLVVMAGWTVWAFAPGRKESFDRAARLPLDGGAS